MATTKYSQNQIPRFMCTIISQNIMIGKWPPVFFNWRAVNSPAGTCICGTRPQISMLYCVARTVTPAGLHHGIRLIGMLPTDHPNRA